jgi:hypothetical protein
VATAGTQEMYKRLLKMVIWERDVISAHDVDVHLLLRLSTKLKSVNSEVDVLSSSAHAAVLGADLLNCLETGISRTGNGHGHPVACIVTSLHNAAGG